MYNYKLLCSSVSGCSIHLGSLQEAWCGCLKEVKIRIKGPTQSLYDHDCNKHRYIVGLHTNLCMGGGGLLCCVRV